MPTTSETALSRFLYNLAAAATEYADEITSRDVQLDGASLDDVYLGSAQRAMAELPGMRSDKGLSPREVCTLVDNDDEPNVRTSLNGMVKRGVMERVPGITPQRFRLVARYRSE
jgi:hypothetical protein